MPASSGSQSLAAAAYCTASPGLYPNNRDNYGSLQVSGTFGTCVGSVQYTKDPLSVADASAKWSNLDLQRADTLALEATPTLTDNTTRAWNFQIPLGATRITFRLASIVSGAIVAQVDTNFTSNPAFLTSLTSGALVGLQTITVTNTATSGTAIGNAGAVAEGFNVVTGGNNSAAVILPAIAPGKQVTIVNTVQTATLQVFPQALNSINNLANNAVYNVPNGGKRTFTGGNGTVWYTDPQTIL